MTAPAIDRDEARASDHTNGMAIAAFVCTTVGWSSLMLVIGRSGREALSAVGTAMFFAGVTIGGGFGLQAARQLKRGGSGGWMATIAIASAFAIAGLLLVQLVMGAVRAAS
jgi:hypothetical protein